MTIINDDGGIINKLDASLTEDNRVIIYDHHMFIVQATGTFCLTSITSSCHVIKLFFYITHVFITHYKIFLKEPPNWPSTKKAS
jgi:hypothetical protein